jgi:hypothetical protein
VGYFSACSADRLASKKSLGGPLHSPLAFASQRLKRISLLLIGNASASANFSRQLAHMYLQLISQATPPSRLHLLQESCSNEPCELDKPEYKTDEFRLYQFKIKQCTNEEPHDWCLCPFAHPGNCAAYVPAYTAVLLASAAALQSSISHSSLTALGTGLPPHHTHALAVANCCPANHLPRTSTSHSIHVSLYCTVFISICCAVLQARRRIAGTPVCSSTQASRAQTIARAPASAATHAHTHTVRSSSLHSNKEAVAEASSWYSHSSVAAHG